MKVTTNVIASWNKYSKDFEYRLSPWKPGEGDESVFVTEKEVEFESLDDKLLRQRIYAAMQGKRLKILADAQLEATEIAEMAQELLALEYKPEEKDDDTTV